MYDKIKSKFKENVYILEGGLFINQRSVSKPEIFGQVLKESKHQFGKESYHE